MSRANYQVTIGLINYKFVICTKKDNEKHPHPMITISSPLTRRIFEAVTRKSFSSALNSTPKKAVGSFRVPSKIFCNPGCLKLAIAEYAHKKRAFVVTDKPLYDVGISRKVTDVLDSFKIEHKTFYHVEADPILGNVMEGLEEVKAFKPDVIFAIGGGSPLDVAKVIRVLYENPRQSFADLAARCINFHEPSVTEERIASGVLSDLICIPTTSGTGSDVTPYAIITDESSETNEHHSLADYALMPSMSIVDSELSSSMPPALTAHSGLFALAHAIEAHASPLATDFTRALSLQAAVLVFRHLPRAVAAGAKAPDAREALHHAATMAGMALANTSPGGVCHALAHR